MNEFQSDSLTCVETEAGVQNWPSTAYLSPSIREAVMTATVVLLPQDGFRDHPGPVFPAGTNEFFLFLRSKVSSPDQVEIAVEDSQYVEVALHGRIARIATLFVTLYVAPTIANLTATFLAHRLGNDFNTAEVHASMIVEDNHGADKKSWKLTYEGPASTYEKTLKEALSHLSLRKAETKHKVPSKTEGAKHKGETGHGTPTKDSKPCQ